MTTLIDCRNCWINGDCKDCPYRIATFVKPKLDAVKVVDSFTKLFIIILTVLIAVSL
jgi:hypothetical protein